MFIRAAVRTMPQLQEGPGHRPDAWPTDVRPRPARDKFRVTSNAANASGLTRDAGAARGAEEVEAGTE
jgi:hypothetical protein